MLLESLESSYSHLCQSGETLKVLINFYKNYKRLHEELSTNLSDLTFDLISSERVKSLSSCLVSTSDFIKGQSLKHFDLSQSIQTQILDPLSTFSENFNISVFDPIKNTKESVFKLEETREKMRKKREMYFLASVRAEKAEKIVFIEDEEDRLELAKKNAEEMRQTAIQASAEYFSAVAEEKQVWGDCEDYRQFCIDSLKESEESRVEFVKKILDKHLKLERKIMMSGLEALKEPIGLLERVCSGMEAKEFVKGFLNLQQVGREEWMDYEMWKKKVKEEGKDPLEGEDGWISSRVPYVPMDSYLACMRTVIYGLLPLRTRNSGDFTIDKSPIEVSPKDFLHLDQILENSSTWQTFFDLVEYRKFAFIGEKSKIQDLSKPFLKILTVMQQEEPQHFKFFYQILTISHHIFVIENRVKSYLFKSLYLHPIFQSSLFWKKTIETVISERVDSEKKIFKKNLKKYKKIKVKSFNPGKFEEKLAEKNSAVMYLSQFNFYMTNMKVPLANALSIVHECSQKAHLEPQKLKNIIIELHSINPIIQFEKTQRSKSARQGSKVRGRWGSYLYLGLCLKFLPKHEINTLLEVCKTWNTILRPWHLQKELISDKNVKIRRLVWESVLYRPMGKDYKKLLKDSLDDSQKIKEFEDVITMDVLRSYNHKGLVDLEAVKEILKVYAYYNTKVGYCQGMNYIAGTMYLVFKDTEKSFWAMDELIRINSMIDLFSEELPKLKYLFFALDRMIALNLPYVFDTLVTETITSSAFSSPWFLTLYGALLSQRLELQLRIWDLFIYKGWKILFKVAVLILSRLKEGILWKKYEEIMCLLTGIQSSPFMEIFDERFVEDLGTVKVTNRMLSQIRRDYDKLKSR